MEHVKILRIPNNLAFFGATGQVDRCLDQGKARRSEGDNALGDCVRRCRRRTALQHRASLRRYAVSLHRMLVPARRALRYDFSQIQDKYYDLPALHTVAV
eukprot:6213333-Pleurochrysis_carterae.AAC.1